MGRPRLLIATTNPGKVAEYRLLLGELPYVLVTPAEVGVKLEVEERGATFEENAVAKALTFAQASGLLTLADDSGLEVDALGGAPGVRSARYAGPGATDGDRVQALLEALEGVPQERRTARFRCVIALAWPDGRVETCEGKVEGMVALEPAGENGFGYDPIFYLPERGVTIAHLNSEEKNAISHRGAAARMAARLLAVMVKS
ncbi:MAG: XTP/dITP diphosphatase [Chloroflexi bacterium]|nr:XTP/dITP diphosphatase [Chloroflexota bacterium]